MEEQSRASSRADLIAQEAQLTQRFLRAIDLLASEQQEARIGAVYALERIARDSIKDHVTVMEVILSRLRSIAANGTRSKGKKGAVRSGRSHRREVQVLMQVIARRLEDLQEQRSEREGKPFTMDLSCLDLSGIQALGADLRGANFTSTILQGAVLRGAHLEATVMTDVDFRGADLRGAFFGSWERPYAGSILTTSGTLLSGVDLRGAKLFGLKDFSEEQFVGAIVDEGTGAPTDPPPTWWADLVARSASPRPPDRVKKPTQ